MNVTGSKNSIEKLGQKNLFYSILLAAVMMLFLVGYFVLMLPSLYVSYTQEQNLEAIKKQHQAFVKNGSYEGVQVKNPAACASVKISLYHPTVELMTKQVSIKITAADAQTEKLLEEIQELIRSLDIKKMEIQTASDQDQISENTETYNQKEERKKAQRALPNERIKEKMHRWLEELAELLEQVQLPFRTEIVSSVNDQETFSGEAIRLHVVSEHMIIIESGIEDDNNRYTNYLAAERVSDGMVISILPVITPEMEEIRPIVMQSLPMLCAVILVLVLIFSQIYSSGIVLPVYQKLQHVNQTLSEENERQEMFLRASSHQLKTPVTAALLLLDGMIGRIGRYKDTETYLPKVKEQLLSMRSMVEEILSLNKNSGTQNRQKIMLYEMVQAQLDAYRVAAAEKQLEFVLEGDREACAYTDGDRLFKILDNLIANAVAYTPPGHRIYIFADRQGFVIRNEGAAIPQEIISHIFEPFVRGEHEKTSHGLGLYIAAYYAKWMGAQLQIRNLENSVEAVLKLNSMIEVQQLK